MSTALRHTFLVTFVFGTVCAIAAVRRVVDSSSLPRRPRAVARAQSNDGSL